MKLEVIERDSLTKHSLGTGFFVGTSGHLITNYHVVSETIRKPQLYGIEYVIDGGHRPGTVIAVDVVHDLAVVATQESGRPGFSLEDVRPDQGIKLYSLGHPHDLGLTIVEGTYNGLLEHRLYEQLHFTGAINAGMSGGPALLADGRVIGVNVASMGNSLGFLVPITFASSMLTTLHREGPMSSEKLHEVITRQILAHQQQVFGHLEAKPESEIHLGPYSVPGKLAPFLHCWASNADDDHLLYAKQTQRCETDDGIYLDADLMAGTILFRHAYYHSKGLDAFRFASLLENEVDDVSELEPSERSSHTEFRCRESNIEHSGLPSRALLCMRAYRRYPGLFDVMLKVATLDSTEHAVVSMMKADGVSYDTGTSLGRTFMEGVTWRR